MKVIRFILVTTCYLLRCWRRLCSFPMMQLKNRLLLPKQLLDHASIDREIILFAYADRIEVWNNKTYLDLVSGEPGDFAQLAEKVMGNTNISNTGDDLS